MLSFVFISQKGSFSIEKDPFIIYQSKKSSVKSPRINDYFFCFFKRLGFNFGILNMTVVPLFEIKSIVMGFLYRLETVCI